MNNLSPWMHAILRLSHRAGGRGTASAGVQASRASLRPLSPEPFDARILDVGLRPGLGTARAGRRPGAGNPPRPGHLQAPGCSTPLRQIPEACARIQGRFTGDPADPYKFELVRTSPNCAPRAKLEDAAKAKPSEAGGWKFNDLVRVPSTQCATQFAVVRVWRKPSSAAVPPKLDAQGKARLYLKDMTAAAKAG